MKKNIKLKESEIKLSIKDWDLYHKINETIKNLKTEIKFNKKPT
jgi:hypothetical protein